MRSVNAESLEDLVRLMKQGHPTILEEDGRLSIDLPTFGGDRPESRHNAWSWDHNRILVGECPSDLTIIDRYEPFEW